MDDALDLPSWSLDQALLWVATRSLEVISSTISSASADTGPISWMIYRTMLLSGASTTPCIVDPVTAEAKLLAAIQRGRIKARRDLNYVPELWFFEAEYKRDFDTICFKRRDMHPFSRVETSSGSAHLQYAIELLHPMFDPKELISAFPSLITSSGPAVAEQMQELKANPATHISNRPRAKSRQQKVARALDELYPNGVPEPVDLPNQDLVRAVGEKLGKSTPSNDTILRAAGRRLK